MKYTKEIKKGFLIFGTLAVFAIIAIIILFIVANIDYNAVNNFIQTFKIKNERDLKLTNDPEKTPYCIYLNGTEDSGYLCHLHSLDELK